MTRTITKQRSDAPAGMFALEVAGLSWLGAAGPDAVPVAEVVSVDQHHLTLTKITRVQPDRVGAAAFGYRLAHTHAAGASAWGAAPPGHDDTPAWIGDLPQRNVVEDTWGQMYAEHRVLAPARIARDRQHLGADDLRRIERLAGRIAAGVFDDDSPPARIHGDLWSGNVIPAREGFTLIDPAAHGGHPLTDLAMLDLFGNPHLELTLAAYEEVTTLPDGWREQLGLHQLHPLLVHSALFGGGYCHQAMATVRRYA